MEAVRLGGLCIALSFLQVSSKVTLQHPQQLIDASGSRDPYDYLALPQDEAHHGEAVTVHARVSFKQLVDLIEKYQELTTVVQLHLSWTDYNLRWEPGEYNGSEFAHFMLTQVWHPDMKLLNSRGRVFLESPDDPDLVYVRHDGMVTWSPMLELKSACYVQVGLYPFDEQNCSMLFGSGVFDSSMVNFVVTEQQDPNFDAESKEYEVIDTPCTTYNKTLPIHQREFRSGGTHDS